MYAHEHYHVVRAVHRPILSLAEHEIFEGLKGGPFYSPLQDVPEEHTVPILNSYMLNRFRYFYIESSYLAMVRVCCFLFHLINF